MATMGEFGSLLQLGFGIGAGLSVFRALIESRVTRLRSMIDNEIGVTSSIQSIAMTAMAADLNVLKVDLSQRHRKLKRWQRPFLAISLIGALINWTALIIASFDAGYVLSFGEEWILVALSVGLFAIIFAALWLMADYQLGSIGTRFEEICGATK